MRPGDRQDSGARAVRGDCRSRLEGALPRARAASQEDGPAREQLGAQLRFGHRPAGPRCGFSQVPGSGAGQQGRGSHTPPHSLFGAPAQVPEPGRSGSWSWVAAEQTLNLSAETVECVGTRRGGTLEGRSGSRIEDGRGPAAIGRLGLSQVPGPTRAGAPELSRAGDAAGAPTGRVRVAAPGALLVGRGWSGTIAAPALLPETLLPETVRDEKTESLLGLQ